MTVTTQSYSYLEDSYLDQEYLKSSAVGSMGWQAKFVIKDQKVTGAQFQAEIHEQNTKAIQIEQHLVDKLKETGAQIVQIINKQNSYGSQSTFLLVDKDKPIGAQLEGIINAQSSYGMQSEFTIKSDKPLALQTEFNIVDSLKNSGMQFTSEVKITPDYGLQALYVIEDTQKVGIQFEGHIIDKENSLGVQIEWKIVDTLKPSGVEVRSDKYPTLICSQSGYLTEDYLTDPYLTARLCHIPGMQSHFHIVDSEKNVAFQYEAHIIDKLKAVGVQIEWQILDKLHALGFQADAKVLGSIATQFLATLYNTSNLRILCEFPSRGVTSGNWTANSTAAGDFSVDNVNTDVVEQVWRSDSAITGVHLDCDTGIPQGVFLDTFAMFNHNLSSSANVVLIGSNDPTFITVGVTHNIQIYSENAFWIAPALPNAGYRYWRLAIDDNSNVDGYLQIGTIVFGSSKIFHGECFVDQLQFELNDFADTVRTEGHTNVANSRALKRKVNLEFRSLLFQGQNFKNLREIFENSRTTFKCLWIPTPDPVDSRITERFAVFGKLSKIPSERHNSKGPNTDYVSVVIEVDEAL